MAKGLSREQQSAWDGGGFAAPGELALATQICVRFVGDF
jgi:hypothetical protein